MSETEDYDKSATPTAHKTKHQDGGDDELSVKGLAGELTAAQKSTWAKVADKPATFPPTAHKTNHQNGGTDELDLTGMDGKIAKVKDDTAPELGGELDAGAHSIGFTQGAATGDGTTTIDWKTGNKFKFTFGAQNDIFTFTAPSNPCNLLLVILQDGEGSRTLTWPGTMKWIDGTAPTLSTGAGAIDIVSMYYDGTNYYGQIAANFS